MVLSTLFAGNYPKLRSSEITLPYRKDTLLQSIDFPWSPTVHSPLFYWFYFAYHPSCLHTSIPAVSRLNCGRAVIRVV